MWRRLASSLRGLTPARAAMVLVIAGLVHRGLLLWSQSDQLTRLVSANPTWLTWQYLSPRAMTTELATTLLYLQETPPAPTLVVAVVCKLFGWPYGSAFGLIVLNALLSVGTAVLLFRLLLRVVKPWLGLVVAMVFLLSPDLVVMEYNSFGQTIYENLAMFLLLAAIRAYGRARDTNSLSSAIVLGGLTGALALTRSSYSYFFLIPAFFLLMPRLPPFRRGIRDRPPRRAIAGFAVAVICTQCLWSVKNLVVYRGFSLSTSSWQGMNLAVGLDRFAESVDQGWRPASPGREPLVRSILSNPARYPEWFVRMVDARGIAHWHSNWEPFIPIDVREQDQRIQQIMNGENSRENSVAVSTISSLYTKAWTSFALSDPSYMLRKFVASYGLFWLPIRNYGSMFVGPLQVFARVTDGLSLGQAAQEAVQEVGCDDQYEMLGSFPKKLLRPTCFYTMPWLPAVMRLVNLLVIHAGIPCLILAYAVTRRRVATRLPREFLLMVAIYVYAAIVMNLAEHAENMRFRLSVEPMIWLMSCYALAAGVALARALTGVGGKVSASAAVS